MTQARTVFLIGTSHTYQRSGHTKEGEFRKLIAQLSAAFRVRAIAEEMSLEALEGKQASRSLCDEFAEAAGLSHRYYDPNNEQRKALNIRGKQSIELDGFYRDWSVQQIEQTIAADHAIRERYWLGQLFQLDSWPALFVCGADHIHTFSAMLKNEGVNVDVVMRDWPIGAE